MKLYRVDYGHDNGMDGRAHLYCGSKREAEQERHRLIADGIHDESQQSEVEIILMEVPTNKRGLIEFLNREHSNDA